MCSVIAPFFVCIASLIFCKGYSQKSLEGLITTEKDFAAYSIAVNTKEAFLKYIDSAAIHLDNKGNVINGAAFWTNAEKRNTKLNWWPEYSELSASHDFGFNTGPWKLYPSSINDTPVARGHFVTIRHLDKNNHWKFLLDLGISYPVNAMSKPSKPETKQSEGSNKKTANIIEIERSFIQSYEKNIGSAYATWLSSKSRVNRNGYIPAKNKEEQKTYIDSLPLHVAFQPLGSYVSPSNDLAVVYGNTISNGKKENYMRIWRREQNRWKIALEVVRF